MLITVKNSVFAHLVSEVSGTAFHLQNAELKEVLISQNLFLDNICSASYGEGGSVFVNSICSSCTVRSCVFDHNAAFFSSAYFISLPGSFFPVEITETLICCDFNCSDSSHLDIIGGKPLNFNNINITRSFAPSYGYVIHYAHAERPSAFRFINFDSNSAGYGYFLHDKTDMPSHYYFEKGNFNNNSIEYFYTNRINSLGKEPEYFNCNFVFSSIVPIFNFKTYFHFCYFSTDISSQENCVIDNQLDSLEQILIPNNIFGAFMNKITCKQVSIQMIKFQITIFFLIK